MADFVAVIKRAVDGLSDNSPAMRVRVYEKARAAVRRQLENMTPRPPGEAIEAQLAKLEDAIARVEAENAAPEALDEGLVFEDLEPTYEAAPQPAPSREPEHAVEPEPATEPGPAADSETAAQTTVAPRSAGGDPVTGEEEHAQPDREPEPARENDADAGRPGPAAEPAPPQEPQPTPASAAKTGPQPVPFGTYAIGRAPSFPIPPHRDGNREHSVNPQEGFTPSRYRPGFTPPGTSAEPAPSEGEERHGDIPQPEPVAAMELPEPVEETPRSVAGSIAEEPTPRSDAGEAQAPAMAPPPAEPVEAQQLAGNRSEAKTGADREAREPQDVPPLYTDFRLVRPAPERSRQAENEADVFFEEEFSRQTAYMAEEPALSDRGGSQTPTAGATGEQDAEEDTFAFEADDDRLAQVRARAAARRSEASKKPSGGGKRRLAIGAIVLLAFVGLGYAGWANQDRLMALFERGEPAGSEIASGQATEGSEGDDVAALEPDADGEGAAVEKFTQRLLPSGREVDPGPAPAEGDSTASDEGRSLAMQSQDGVTGEDGGASDQDAEGTISENEISESTVANREAAESQDVGNQDAIGVGQTMFLYEERQGDSPPTALEGSVVWSLVEEAPAEDAAPEPAIRGEITVPENDFSARITIRRNADASLPASHLIELVFSLPEDFGGGGIESVRRVAFKETEQDRGNEVIAVPAKITDDFFMVALNDYPEAVETNLELMREREWIDIPIVYANGRRALITLEKGSTGIEAFNEAINLWERRATGTRREPAANGEAGNNDG